MYVSNSRNTNFGDLPFYGDQRFIPGQQIYRANDDILERFNNALIADMY